MNIEMNELSDLLGSVRVTGSVANHAWEIGKNYLIFTVTMALSGRLVGVTQHELVLADAAWIPDTGRLSDAVASATFNEVEPFPDGQVVVGRGALVYAAQITSAPRVRK